MIRISALRAAALALAALLVAPAASAQDNARPVPPPPTPISIAPAEKIANPQPDHPAYGDLLDAIDSTVDKGLVIDNGLAAIRQQMESDNNLAEAEAASPGILDEILATMRPVLEQQNLRVAALYRPRMAAAVADYITPEEAGKVAAFYRSEIGRKLMGNVVKNFSMDQTMAKAMTESPVSETDVNADITSAVAKGVAEMGAGDLAEMGKQALANPALFRFQRVSPQFQRLRTQMENEALTPEEDAAINAAIEAIFTRRFPE